MKHASAALSGAVSESASPALRIALGGNDSSCARGNLARPCASFDRAYRLARPGDIIEVAGATYPSQTITYHAGKAAPNVVFREATGQAAVVGGVLHIGYNTGNSNGRPAQFVTFDGIDIHQA